MEHIWLISFWGAISLILFAYFGFPFLLFIAAKFLRKQVHKAPYLPKMTLIIAAYNEAQGIAKKIENSLNLDYPSDKLEIIIASDGSSDATVDIAKQYIRPNVKVLAFPRRGKIFALRDSVEQASGEILVFSDANTEYHPQALKELAENFADPAVGGVCGNQLHKNTRTADNASEGEKLYWQYDKWLKQAETLTGSIVSADGAIYAIRKELFEMPADTAVTDDFAISTGVVEKGYRLVFDANALAYEDPMPNAEKEFSRKVRIMNRGLRGVIMRKSLLNPFKTGFFAVVLFTHKVLRRLVPFFLILLLVSSLALFNYAPFYRYFAIAQLLFYGLALLGWLLRHSKFAKMKPLYIPFFFCLANAAALIAVINILSGKRIEQWTPGRENPSVS
jgi:cellulose synthase/poly-beta-1,6-N-acetylglucosamine synthase-like glycosyltransferase